MRTAPWPSRLGSRFAVLARQIRNQRYRRVLWAVLGINAFMFPVEIVVGLAASSVSLQADAPDFLADATNYGISLFVAGMPLRYRASAAGLGT